MYLTLASYSFQFSSIIKLDLNLSFVSHSPTYWPNIRCVLISERYDNQPNDMSCKKRI